jgi:hypothetical protein
MHNTEASARESDRDVLKKLRSRFRALEWGIAAILAVGAPAVVIAADQVKGQRYFELDAGSKYTTARALCEAVAKADRATPPYDRVVGAQDKGDSVWCERADSSGNKTDQHHGSVRIDCPANSQLSADGACTCDEQFTARNNVCVPASASSAKALPDNKGVKSPEERGMTEIDDVIFQGIATNRGLFIIVRDSNPAAPNFNGKPGYLPKPEALKAKTRKAKIGPDGKAIHPNDPWVGLAAADPNDPGLIAMLQASKPPRTYEDYVSELKQQVPSFLVGPAPNYLIYTRLANKQTNKVDEYYYYSDYDMHGVYDSAGRPAFANPEFQKMMNARFTHHMVQHGAHDDWKDNMKPGPNCGPMAGVSAYLPTGEIVYLATIDDMAAFYSKHKLPWRYGPVSQIAAKCAVAKK